MSRQKLIKSSALRERPIPAIKSNLGNVRVDWLTPWGRACQKRAVKRAADPHVQFRAETHRRREEKENIDAEIDYQVDLGQV